MPKRIVINLKPEARGDLDAIAARLSRQVDMRVGAAFPRQGLIVGEVQGQMEIDRIAAMEEVDGVRVNATVSKSRIGRSAHSSASVA